MYLFLHTFCCTYLLMFPLCVRVCRSYGYNCMCAYGFVIIVYQFFICFYCFPISFLPFYLFVCLIVYYWYYFFFALEADFNSFAFPMAISLMVLEIGLIMVLRNILRCSHLGLFFQYSFIFSNSIICRLSLKS